MCLTYDGRKWRGLAGTDRHQTYAVRLNRPAIASTRKGIYLIGGVDRRHQAISSVELCKASSTFCSLTYSLPKPVSNAAAVAIRDDILLLGGFDGKRLSDEVLLLRPFSPGWKTIGHLAHPRSSHLSYKIGTSTGLLNSRLFQIILHVNAEISCNYWRQDIYWRNSFRNFSVQSWTAKF